MLWLMLTTEWYIFSEVVKWACSTPVVLHESTVVVSEASECLNFFLLSEYGQLRHVCELGWIYLNLTAIDDMTCEDSFMYMEL